MAPSKIIIDTDPGVDDVMAILLAISALSEELEVLLLSVTYGNIDVGNCIRNVVSLFHHVEEEIKWREANGKRLGFDTLRKTKPLVSIGPDKPLNDQMMMADYYHGTDGLAGIKDTHPHLAPNYTWTDIIAEADRKTGSQPDSGHAHKNERLFTPSSMPAHKDILKILKENDPDTVTIVAVGPLTNCAMAAAEDPETFLRVKEVVVMGSNITEEGNMTPVAEFNTFADSLAAARLYALTSPNPLTTMPPSPQNVPEGKAQYLGKYPEKLSRQLKVMLFPLDITNYHQIKRGEARSILEPQLAAKSPLAEWINAFLTSTFAKVESLQSNVSGDQVGLQLHDPLCVWYCMSGALDPKWKFKRDEDIRVETSGQWTRGMCVIDTRTRKKREDDIMGEIPSDHGNWLSPKAGNRIDRCVETPGRDTFGGYMLKKVLNL